MNEWNSNTATHFDLATEKIDYNKMGITKDSKQILISPPYEDLKQVNMLTNKRNMSIIH